MNLLEIVRMEKEKYQAIEDMLVGKESEPSPTSKIATIQKSRRASSPERSAKLRAAWKRRKAEAAAKVAKPQELEVPVVTLPNSKTKVGKILNENPTIAQSIMPSA